VLAFADATGAPVVRALLGKALIPDRSPYTTGGIGLLGTAPSQGVLQECDTFLIAGSSFTYMEFLPKPGQTKTIQIDMDVTRIRLRHPGRVEVWRQVAVGLVYLLLPISFGSASLTKPCTVSSPRHLARSVRISRTTRSCTLCSKGYET
jgi:thiamine pyrophosphate-dependent acetolactate synthase large subunit-like protein